MAGHSKWANIKHKKAANDKKRGKIWTKLLREVTVAARAGGGDVETNPRLRLAVDKANAANVPKDTTDRAVKRGAGGEDTDHYDEIRYEGYGAGGTAVMVDCMTDNRNRTASEVRHAFTKLGGNLGTDGSVSYLFSSRGLVRVDQGVDEEQLFEVVLEAGAEDVVTCDDGSVDVIATPEAFAAVKDAAEAAGFPVLSAEVSLEAETQVTLDREAAETLIQMVEALEDLDDVQEVYTNADISDEIMDAIG